ncbi:MAG: hypothetical protein GY862_33225 [Gammaproteobacteria bacterium]|nr:hypothetical protein [Gammaproteobacteria bacterium]
MTMNRLSNPLPPVWKAFIVSRDALQLARKALKPPVTRPSAQCQTEIEFYRQTMIHSTVFANPNTGKLLDIAMIEADNLFVIALWATFERFLREYLQSKTVVLKTHVSPSDLGDAVYGYCHKEIEYWRPDDILDFLQKAVLKAGGIEQLKGKAIQIYNYRNYLAHGKNRQQLTVASADSYTSARQAYTTLKQIIDILLVN